MGKRFKPSPAMVVAMVALVASLSGVAVAVQGPPANNSVASGEVVNGSLKGKDIAPSTLGGPHIDESTLSVPALGCQSGKVQGFVRVDASASFPDTYTSSASNLDFPGNCSGAGVQARRLNSPGDYYVRFVDNPAALALVTSNGEQNGYVDTIVTVEGPETAGNDAGAFRVHVWDISSDAFVDQDFTVVVP